MSRKKFLCMDCKVDTGKIHEHYMLHDEVWLSVVEDKSGMLCISCIENRLGRALTENDFVDCTLNKFHMSGKSDRLTQRLTS